MVTSGLAKRGEERFWSAVRFAQVRSAKRERTRRAKYLSSDLFVEPAWDLLLELYSFELLGRCATEAQLIERLGGSADVVIRWLKMLELQNLIARAVDPERSATVYVQLTGRGSAAMNGYFSEEG